MYLCKWKRERKKRISCCDDFFFGCYKKPICLGPYTLFTPFWIKTRASVSIIYIFFVVYNAIVGMNEGSKWKNWKVELVRYAAFWIIEIAPFANGNLTDFLYQKCFDFIENKRHASEIFRIYQTILIYSSLKIQNGRGIIIKLPTAIRITTTPYNRKFISLTRSKTPFLFSPICIPFMIKYSD